MQLASSMKPIYLFGGIGADHRVFDYLDLSPYEKVPVVWIAPLKEETIEDYAKRLLTQIPTSKPILMGVSFGGMIAMELGKLIETEKIILISSVRTREDLPGHFKWIDRINRHIAISPAVLKKSQRIACWFFSVKEKWEKDLLCSIIQDTNDDFLVWAIEKLTHWENEKRLENVVKIHGTKDRLLPITTADYKVEKGGHFMVINRAREISDVLKGLLGAASY